MLLNYVEVHSSIGVEPLVSDFDVVPTLFTDPHLLVSSGCSPQAKANHLYRKA